MSKKTSNPILEAKQREKEAREKLAQAQLLEAQGQVHESFIEQLEKKAENPNHEVKVKAEPERKVWEQELARRALAKKHLLPFVVRTLPGYEAGWFHMDLCRRLEQFMRDVEDRKSPRLIVQVPPRHGKKCTHDTPVLTDNGWTTHGDLTPGDKVFHPSGKPIEVIALSPETTSEYIVTTSNGEKIECHGNHEWTVYDRSAKKWVTYETKEMYNGRTTRNGTHVGVVYSGTPGKRGCRYTYQLPNIEAPLQFDEKDLPIDPYTLGVWLGDGHKESARVTFDVTADAHIEWIKHNTVYKIDHVWPHSDKINYPKNRDCTIKGLVSDLRSNNLLGNKHIPEVYLRASVTQRLELLAGLIDTDGSLDKTQRIRFTTTTTALRDGVVDLATTLGMRPYVTTTEPHLTTSGIQGRKEVYIVHMMPYEGCKPDMRIQSKQVTKYKLRRRIAITDISPTKKPKLGRCIQVDSEDGLYLVGKQLVPTHNSQLASINFPGWVLGHHPDWNIIATSYAASLAEGFSKKARDMVASTEYTTVFKTRLDENAKSVQSWHTNKGGVYTAAGVGGGIVGKGAHILIIDDPFKTKEDAHSENNRQNVKDWYNTAAYTRLAPGGGVLIVMQRWHEDDLAGWLMKQAEEADEDDIDVDRFEVVHYPAIAEHDEKYRKEGEPLHPERYPYRQLMKYKRQLLPADWEALYQQNPTSADGDYFSRDMFHSYEPKDRPPLSSLAVYQAWDLAIGTKESNDYSVGACIGVDENDNHYVLEVRTGRWSAFDLVEEIMNLANRYSPRTVGIETSQIEMALGPLLGKRMRETGNYLNIERLKPGRRDKMLRARPLQGRMQQGMVLWPMGASWFQSCQNEMLAFPAGKHDDQVDALAWIYLMLENMRTPHIATPKPKKGWRDRIKSKSTKQSSAMTA